MADEPKTRVSSGRHGPSSSDPRRESEHLAPTTPINAGRGNRSLTLLAKWGLRPGYPRPLRKLTLSLLSKYGLHIKTSRFNGLTEAHTLQYVAAHTGLPVPRIHCAFIRKEVSYIVMSKIDGHIAAYQWSKRSDKSKTAILDQLRTMIEELRAVPAPHGFKVESVTGGPLFDPRLPRKTSWGPYPNVAAFHEALLDLGSFSDEIAGLRPEIARMRDWLRQMPEATVLTHADLSSLNIMVRGDKVVGIVDWETAGWLPPYWEYCCTWNVNPYNEFWQHEVDKFFTSDPDTLELDGIRRRFFGPF